MPTVKVPARLADPETLEQVGEVTRPPTEPVIVHPVSEVLKPDPATEICTPGVTTLGVSVIEGTTTVNGTEMDPCWTKIPEIVTVCAPGAAPASTV